MGKIVVGVDGSEESKAALEWAAEEAGLRGHDLVVVHAFEGTPPWHLYGDDGGSAAYVAAVREQIESVRKQAEEHADALVGAMLSALGDTGDLTIERVVISDGHPASVLVDQAQAADMVVVGSRGRGGFSGLLLGSVSQQVASHAPCPVVIISRHAHH